MAAYARGARVDILAGDRANVGSPSKKELSPSSDLSSARAELVRLAYPGFGAGTTVVGIVCRVAGVLDSRGC